MRRLFVVLVCVCSVALLRHPLLAHAQGTQDDEARALFEAGLVAYESERFESALMYFQRSLSLSGRAKLHYNLGLAFERLGRVQEAIHSYDEYLKAIPDAENRAEVEKRISALRAWRAGHPVSELGGEATPSTQPVVQSSPVAKGDAAQEGAPHRARTTRRVGWILLGSGGALLAGGAACLGLALHANNQVEHAAQGSSWHAVADDRARAFPLSVAGISLAGAGLVSAALGSVFVVRGRTVDVQVSLAPRGLALGGRF